MASRIERLLSLLNVLIGAERPVSADRIRERVPGYPDDQASFQRQFERDKRALRDMGLAVDLIEVPGSYPPAFGYRIPRDQAHLRDPGLEPDELAALALAASAIRLDGIEGSGGLWKLGGGPPAAGDNDRGVVDLPADPRLVDLFGAVSDRRIIEFAYNSKPRQVDPWRLDCTRGRWYLTGFDHDSGSSRHFRLDRFEGDLIAGRPGGFERPSGGVEGVRMEAWLYGGGPEQTAEVLVDADHLDAFLQTAPTARMVEQRTDGATVVELRVTELEAFRSMVIGFLDHVEVIGPPAFRDDLISWLDGVLERLGR